MTRPHLLEGNTSGSVANLSLIHLPLKLSGRLSELFWVIIVLLIQMCCSTEGHLKENYLMLSVRRNLTLQLNAVSGIQGEVKVV